MNLIKTKLDGLVVLKPTVFKDNRGYFMESYNQKNINKLLGNVNFVQDNESESNRGVLRGLHFQNPPYVQAKLVRVIRGSVLDVAVDLRTNSPTYGKHFTIVLSGENFKSFYIPKGFAHGFIALEDNTIFSYKCSDMYNKEFEGCLMWNDKDLGIDWNVSNPIISPKDMQGLHFKDFKSNFDD